MSDNVSERKRSDVGAKRELTLEKGARSSDSSVYKSSAEMSVRSKGSKGSSLYKGSEEYFEYSCDPCSTVGDHAEAQGYCTNCEEYLCGTCFRSHSRSKLLKHHILLDKDSMPRKKEKLCDPCHTAGDELQAVGYCQNCKEYLCSSCFKSHSRTKLLRHHVLIDIANMTTSSDHAVTDLVVDLHIGKHVSSDIKGTEEYTFIRDINVKADTDENNCYITEMALVSNTTLVLCDATNICLKLVDIESSTIKDVLVLKGVPFGITTISNHQVAVVAYKNHQIQIISVTGGLTVENTIKAHGVCVDVKLMNEQLYVSFWKPVKFQILQPTGAIIKTIKPDSEVLKHCLVPRHIAISPGESRMYMSDWKTNKVLSMDMDGNMIAMYQGELRTPFDITVSLGGSVYLCNRDQNVVYKMTSDLSEATVILETGDGFFGPQAMCFNINKQELYISSRSVEAKHASIIKVYQWT